MRPLLPLTLLLAVPLVGPAHAKRPDAPTVAKVPSIEEVVAAEGFVPTPSQSEIYKPGAVLVPNDRGGHDVVVSRCIEAEPEISIMSQSSIATTLAGGVSARLGVARGAASAGVEKRLSFVDPEQRTIPLARLLPTEACTKGVKTAAAYQELSDAIVLHDVLVAIIKNTVCTKADASGGVVALGAAEAAAYSECVQESDGQVPLGYKAVPLDKVLSLAGTTATVPTNPTSVVPGTPATATSTVDFGSSGGLGIDAQLKEQACEEDAKEKGAAARAARLSGAEQDAKSKASAAWSSLVGELEKCTQLKQSQRGKCVQAAEQWLATARSMPVSLPAGVEPIETACGVKQPAFAGESRTAMADELGAAEAMLVRLQAADALPVASVSAGAEWTGPSGYAMVGIAAGSFTMGSPASEKGRDDDETEHRVTLSKGFLMGKTEVTQGLWRAVMGSNPSQKSYEGVSLLGDGLPVQNVSWCDAVAFANKLSSRDGLSAAYSGVDQCNTSKGTSVRWERSSDGYRLPTEAEWEYAARAGKAGPYAGGVSEEGACRVANVADSTAKSTFSGWTTFSCDDGVAGLAPVGRYAANPWGLHDMTGNVREWCWDWFADYSGTSTDPVGAQSGTSRVSRGGSWCNGPRYARVADRNRNTLDRRSDYLGLRLVRTSP